MNLKFIKLSVLFLFFIQTVSAQTVADWVNKYQKIAKKYLIKHTAQGHYFDIDAKGISIFPSHKAKKENKPECLVYWEEIEAFQNLFLYEKKELALEKFQKKGAKPFSEAEKKYLLNLSNKVQTIKVGGKKPLAGKKVAIDPGHIAGNLEMAKIEGRFIETEINGKQINFFEAGLSLSVAKLIKKELEKHGAGVLITRPYGNRGADGILFEDWKNTTLPKILNDELKQKKITAKEKKKLLNFTAKAHNLYYVKPDLEKRAELINNFQPDLTIIIHFNADPVSKKDNSAHTKKNYNMVFVAGAFTNDELAQAEQRFDFLRLLLCGQIQESVKFSQYVINAFEKKMNVPTIAQKNHLAYLKQNSIFLSKGVYARNLGLCRLVNSPLCYGETLCQNNPQEALRLAENTDEKPAKRIVEIADAYTEAVLKYFDAQR